MESVDDVREGMLTEPGHQVCAAVEGVNQARKGGDQTASGGSHEVTMDAARSMHTSKGRTSASRIESTTARAPKPMA